MFDNEYWQSKILNGGFFIPTYVDVEESLIGFSETWVVGEGCVSNPILGVIEEGNWKFWCD